MADVIRHRGPDGEGFLLFSPGREPEVHHSRRKLDRAAAVNRATVGLAHRRLSIIDLSEASSQPMVDASGELAIAYNGELYNYVELRDELEGRGHRFRTTGDTEVVLVAYAEWGPACVERMVGMWALAVLDLPRRHVFLTVDRFGIKPLFYTVTNGSMYFASEIKGLLAVPGLRVEPDELAVRRFLSIARLDETERTFFDGIHRLKPAHTLSVPLDSPDSSVVQERYWSIPSDEDSLGEPEAAETLRARLTESIRVHSRSDVPVGTCLSGGLDSSAIVCIADRLRREDAVPRYAHTGFGYLTEDPSFSERGYMDEVIEQTGIEMHFIAVSSERFRSLLPEIIRQQDEPFASTSQAAQWFVFDRARQEGLKVMLDGQGADEVLGGYDGFFQSIALASFRTGQIARYLQLNRVHRGKFGVPAIPTRRALAAAVPPAALKRVRGLPRMTVLPMLSDPLRSRIQPADYDTPPFRSTNEILANATGSSSLPSLLRYEDRNSMAHSIEARVPFLDHRLVELAFRLPGDYKIDGVATKRVLRGALDGVVPERIRVRTDKVAFRAEPSVTWKLLDMHLDSLCANRTDYEREWFDPGGIRAFSARSDQAPDAEFTLWRVLNTKIWLRGFWGDGSDPL